MINTNNHIQNGVKKAKGRVLVALSGGVDSSVVLHLLHEEGYQVIGAHMKLWDFAEVGGEAKRDGRCCSLESVDDCRAICDKIGVPFYVLNFVDEFRERVIENFVSEYRAGRTPNPCVICNTEMKWELFLQRAKEFDCEYIATGHYGSVCFDQTSGRYFIEAGEDKSRDQSYALWGLSQEALAQTLLPLGRIPKSRVRELARTMMVRTAERPDSQEICFVADDNYKRFLRHWNLRSQTEFTAGTIVDEQGAKLAEHEGVELFTVGQRRGLGVSGRTPLYVKSINAESGQVVVSENKRIVESRTVVSGVNWMAIAAPSEPIKAQVKIRYLHQAVEATLIPLSPTTLQLEFSQPQRAITPGQSAVFYRGRMVLGGGVIETVG